MSELSKFASNPFLSATERRHPLMTEIIADTLPKIAAAAIENGEFINDNDQIQNLSAQWEASDTVTVNAEALSLSRTQAFETKMDSLTRKLDPETNSTLTAWCLIIEPVAPVGSSLHTLLLPQGRETLTAGSWEVQLNSIRNLGIRLAAQTTKPALVSLSPIVNSFYNSADALRTAQGSAAQALTDAREAQETLRKTCCLLYTSPSPRDS